MNSDRDADDDLASLLIACDDALAQGSDASASHPEETPPELKERLERGLACLKFLHEARPRGGANIGSPEGPEAASTINLAEGTAEAPGGATLGSTNVTVRLGRFEIVRELGRGGFGVVFLARDPQLQREVALKVPRPDALVTPELRERFRQEARAAAGLDHPNLVSVHEAGEVGPICYIASAF